SSASAIEGAPAHLAAELACVRELDRYRELAMGQPATPATRSTATSRHSIAAGGVSDPAGHKCLPCTGSGLLQAGRAPPPALQRSDGLRRFPPPYRAPHLARLPLHHPPSLRLHARSRGRDGVTRLLAHLTASHPRLTHASLPGHSTRCRGPSPRGDNPLDAAPVFRHSHRRVCLRRPCASRTGGPPRRRPAAVVPSPPANGPDPCPGGGSPSDPEEFSQLTPHTARPGRPAEPPIATLLHEASCVRPTRHLTLSFVPQPVQKATKASRPTGGRSRWVRTHRSATASCASRRASARRPASCLRGSTSASSAPPSTGPCGLCSRSRCARWSSRSKPKSVAGWRISAWRPGSRSTCSWGGSKPAVTTSPRRARRSS